MSKFKVGDKVRLKGGFVYDDYKEGEFELITGIIESSDTETQYVLNQWLGYGESKLEPYTEKPTPTTEPAPVPCVLEAHQDELAQLRSQPAEAQAKNARLEAERSWMLALIKNIPRMGYSSILSTVEEILERASQAAPSEAPADVTLTESE